MCGLAGFWRQAGISAEAASSLVERMADTLVHRGPDDSGVWVDGSAGIALAHRRLSILDLSPAGHQPMLSACGRYVMVFNGEIYNHGALRKELEDLRHAPQWRGHSDTEVVLAAFSLWGIQESLKKLVGMFAMAIWDRERRQLALARDRMGEKPLYYGWSGGHFLFGSELKAIRAHPGFQAEIDRGALTLFLRHNYIPAPHSIWQGIQKLAPGTCLVLEQGAVEPRIVPYWSIAEAASKGISEPFGGSPEEAVDELERRLSRSIAGQMVADVPLGAFLSGGVDSSAVVALMQAQSSRPVMTFSIGFHEEGYDEARYAREVAAHLGTDHTELYVTPREAMDIIPMLPSLYDEPFSDSSQIPTFLLAQMTREHVTVSLSGDGGDELFCGYNRYDWANALWSKFDRAPAFLRIGLARLITLLPPSGWSRILGLLSFLIPERYRYANPGDKVHKLAELFSVTTPEQIYFELVSHWKNPARLVLGGSEQPTILTDSQCWLDSDSFEQRMMYLDQHSYLPDDILVKVDRAAMGVSLETRIPMLDQRVVEFAWSLGLDYKLRDNQTKWPLRQLLYRHVPRQLIERPKMGFGVPIDAWLRGPLREWAETLMERNRLLQEGYLRPDPIHEKWREHLSGRRNWAYYLWDVLMFQAWLEQQ